MKIQAKLLLSLGFMAAVVARAETLTWTGAGADANWATPENWNPAQVPADGDIVDIANASGTITLDAPTAELASFTLSGATVSMTNWTTCLSASTVTIGNGGVLTCVGSVDATTNAAGVFINASRVNVVCDDFLLESGGAIDVSCKGFEPPINYVASDPVGTGPFGGTTGGYGGGHGGVGSDVFIVGDRHSLYGSIEAPESPGSSGSFRGWISRGGFGGGVVRIAATGTVTIHGSILAEGMDRLNWNSRGADGAGAGGSIYITCNRFKGENGVLSVQGGAYKTDPNNQLDNGCYADNTPFLPTRSMTGAGGRISVCYNPEAQQAGDISGMRFDAGSGDILHPSEADNAHYTAMNQSDPGTLYFSDSTLFVGQAGQGFAGQLYIPNFDSWTVEGDYVVSTQMRFVNEGFALHVTGNLTVLGPKAALEFGGKEPKRDLWDTSLWGFYSFHSGTTPWNLTVDGNLTLANGASFEAFPAAVNVVDEASAYGAFVNVGGKLTLEPEAILSTRCVGTNGAAVLYSVGSADIQAGAMVYAVDYGFAHGKGPGKGSGAGGGYGGFGGKHYATTNAHINVIWYNGWTYGDPLRPWQPGSGANYSRSYTFHRGGGGAIRIQSKGEIRLDGTMDASAASMRTSGQYSTTPMGSGGSIFLECSKLTGSGALKAEGGDSLLSHDMRGWLGVPAGGGGRIAVYTGVRYNAETMSDSWLAISDCVDETFAGTASVAGGIYSFSTTPEREGAEVAYGTDGTIRFVHVVMPNTLILFK